MKKSKEIVGLRIISIVDGRQIGFVKDYVINGKEGTLDYFIVDQESDYFGAKIISFKDIIGLGEFGLTIPSADVIQDVAKNTAAQELIKQDVRVISTQVLTKKGQFVGEVLDLIIDEETGKIAACIVSMPNGEEASIGSENVITFGKELLIVESFPGQENKNETKESIEEKEPVEDIPAESKEPAENNEPGESDPSSADIKHNGETASNSEFNFFEQKQLLYLIGKSVDTDIVLDNGEVLPANQLITEDTITKITSKNTLMNVTSHLNRA